MLDNTTLIQFTVQLFVVIDTFVFIRDLMSHLSGIVASQEQRVYACLPIFTLSFSNRKDKINFSSSSGRILKIKNDKNSIA